MLSLVSTSDVLKQFQDKSKLLFTRYKWLEVGMTGSPRSSSRKKIALFLSKYLYQQDFTDRSLSKSRLT